MRQGSQECHKKRMPLPRVLEPEVMDTEEEASDYDAMDHGGVNARFCEDLLALDVPTGRVVGVRDRSRAHSHRALSGECPG